MLLLIIQIKNEAICLIPYIIHSSANWYRQGQVPVNDTPQILEELFDRLAGNYNDTDRIHINDSIRTILDSYVSLTLCSLTGSIISGTWPDYVT